MAAIERAIAPNAAWYCWHASARQAMLEAVWNEVGAFMHQQITIGCWPPRRWPNWPIEANSGHKNVYSGVAFAMPSNLRDPAIWNRLSGGGFVVELREDPD
jgi:hypothetical protein